jgi:hypothetical protein
MPGKRPRSGGVFGSANAECPPNDAAHPQTIVLGGWLAYSRPMQRFTLLVLLILVLAAGVQAAVYKWVDAQGVIHYSDRPEEGAVEVQLPEPSIYTPRPLPQSKTPSKPASDDSAQSAAYERFTITSPSEGEYLRNATGDVPVSMALVPDLKPGHRIQLGLDGVGARQTVASTRAVLKEVNRGPHSLSAEVIDEAGAPVISADPVRFFLFREIVDRPKSGDRDEELDQPKNPNSPVPQSDDSLSSGQSGKRSSSYAPSYTPAPAGSAFKPARPDGGSVYAPSYGGGN